MTGSALDVLEKEQSVRKSIAEVVKINQAVMPGLHR